LGVPLTYFLTRAVITGDEYYYFMMVILGVVHIPLLILLMWAFTKPKYDLVLDEKGLLYKHLEQEVGISLVPWNEISKAKTVHYGGGSGNIHIHIHLKEGEFRESLSFSKAHQFILGNNIFINPRLLSGAPKDICAEINRYIHNNAKQQGTH
jgi:hypothetical protein